MKSQFIISDDSILSNVVNILMKFYFSDTQSRRHSAVIILRMLILILLFLGCLHELTAQTNVIQVFSENTATQKGVVQVYSDKGLLYISIRDLALDLNLNFHFNETTHQAEITAKNSRINITADNPFVVIGDTGNINTHQEPITWQLIQSPMIVEKILFVPLQQFLPILALQIGERLTFDDVAHKIMVGTLPPPKPITNYDVSRIALEQAQVNPIIHIFSPRQLVGTQSFVNPDSTIVIILPGVSGNIESLNATKPDGMLKKVIAQQKDSSLHLTIKFDRNFEKLIPQRSDDTTGLALMMTSLEPSPESIREDSIREGLKKQHVLETLEKQRNKWKMDVVVIDAGHGGKDPGAIGIKKTREKTVTLAVALKLGELIKQKLPDVQVVYTRKSDKFVELYRRGQIANEAGGKLFISIHCNSMPRKPSPANGFEIYLLKPGRTSDALEIAERENAVVKLEENYQDRYKEITEENFILLTMAQSAYVKYSELFAQTTVQSMERFVPINNNGVKQAGFYVLVGASMPNVLIEIGYISNRKEEQYLTSTKGQQSIAEAIFTAVKNYKVEYEKDLAEGTQ